MNFQKLEGINGMKILGYGEDALTLWALKNKMPDILACVRDTSSAEECLVLFRPSFGRSGGPTSSQFGEFDFILATPRGVHLGETKWQNSPEVKEPIIELKKEQIERTYYRTWIQKPSLGMGRIFNKSIREIKKGGN